MNVSFTSIGRLSTVWGVSCKPVVLQSARNYLARFFGFVISWIETNFTTKMGPPFLVFRLFVCTYFQLYNITLERFKLPIGT